MHLTLRSSGETATGRHSHALLTCWMSGIYLGNTGRCQPTLLSPVCNRVGQICPALIPLSEEIFISCALSNPYLSGPLYVELKSVGACLGS